KLEQKPTTRARYICENIMPVIAFKFQGYRCKDPQQIAQPEYSIWLRRWPQGISALYFKGLVQLESVLH
ncbi:hypothetical protein E4T56_gene17344, partial [Termitomyces sp. T112]